MDNSWKDGKRQPPYDWEVVRDCAIEAFIRGFQPVGNEFNIISRRFYAAKNGIDRKVREFPGLTDLQHRPGVPVVKDESALVPYTIRYRINGVDHELVRDYVRDPKDAKNIIGDQRIPIRVNRGMGLDGILGKAHRKAMALLLSNLTGSTLTLPVAELGDDEPVIPTTGEPVPGAGAPATAPAAAPVSAQVAVMDEMVQKAAASANGPPSAEEMAEDEKRNAGR